jgi:hypothetical protein
VGLAGCNSYADFGIIVDAPDVSKTMKQRNMLFCATVMHGANQEWTSWVTNLGVWLIEVDTHPSICHCISESLMQRSLLTSFVSHSNLVCHSAALEQDEIGWQNFVEGKISKHWGYLQLLYYHDSHSK